MPFLTEFLGELDATTSEKEADDGGGGDGAAKQGTAQPDVGDELRTDQPPISKAFAGMRAPPTGPAAGVRIPFRDRKGKGHRDSGGGQRHRHSYGGSGSADMSISQSLVWKRPALVQAKPDDGEFRRKKLKLSDLPVSSEKRNTIDGLLLTFKKSGEFDKLRKSIFTQFESSEAKARMLKSIEDLTTTEIERQANYLLSKDRRQAAALIEGAVERSSTYKLVDAKIEELVQTLLGEAEDSLRKVRETEIGEDGALEELKRGGKTDAEYLHAFAERKHARMKLVEAENSALRKLEDEAKRKREEAKRKEEEEEEARERAKEEEREREREEREERRRKEREAREKEREKERERERERERELEKEREERRERRRREDEERERRRRNDSRERSRDWSRDRRRSRDRSRDRLRDRSKDRYSRRYSDDRGSKVLLADDKDLEAIALQELLAAGQKATSSLPKVEQEDEIMEPPPRKMLAPKSIVPRDPAVSKLTRLDSLSKEIGLGTPAKSDHGDSRAGSVLPSIENETTAAEHEEGKDRRSSRRLSPSPDVKRSHRRDAEGDRRGSRRFDRRSRSRGREDVYRPSRRDDSRSRSRTRHRRSPTRSRSRSPPRRRGGRDRSMSGRPRNRREPEKDQDEDDYNIDRYIPNTSRRSPVATVRRDRDKDDSNTKTVNKRREHSRNRDRDDDRRRSRSPIRKASRSPSAAITRRRDRDRDRDRDRSESKDGGPGGRNTRQRYAPDDIDRYVPSTSTRGDLREYRDRDRSRERSATRDSRDATRDRRDRSRSRDRDARRDRSRDRDRDRDRRDRRGGRRLEHDIFRPSGGGRRRSRSPSVERERERERERDRERDDRRSFSSATKKEGKKPPPATGSKTYSAAAPPATPAGPAQLHFTSMVWKKT